MPFQTKIDQNAFSIMGMGNTSKTELIFIRWFFA